MKVVLFCGGQGMRLREYAETALCREARVQEADRARKFASRRSVWARSYTTALHIHGTPVPPVRSALHAPLEAARYFDRSAARANV